MTELNKLRWRCRRGNKELDLLLINYLDQHYLAASAEEQQAFQQLLQLEDPQLMACLLGDASFDILKLNTVLSKLIDV